MIRECPFGNDPQLVGDPVDTYSGAVVERQRDVRLAGPLPLEWWRVYNSQLCDKVFALGRGQSHEFASCLKFDLDGLRFEGPLGQQTSFPPLAQDGQSVSKNGRRLTRIGRSIYRLHEHAQATREFTFSEPSKPAVLKRLFHNCYQILFQYNKQGQLESITDSMENEIFVEFNTQGFLATAYIPKTRLRERRTLLRYDYDQRGNIELMTDVYGNSLKFAYDAANRMSSRTDRNGHTFTYTYDDRGRCIHTSGTDGVLDNRIEYEVDKECTKVTQSNGAVRRYRYELGKLVSIDEPLGGQRKFVYDDQGRLLQELDCNSNATQSVYNGDGALVSKVDPYGDFHAFPPNRNEPDRRSHRVARNAVEYEYGRLVDYSHTPKSTSAVGIITQERSERPASYVEKSDLHSSNNIGFVVGRTWWPEPSSGRRFDLTGNLFQQLNKRGDLRRWIYDANGNIIKFVDFDGGIWTYGYRSWNHLVEETNPLGIANRMDYDSQENITRFIDGGGTASEYNYDFNNKLVEVRRHGTVRETYQRDAAGNLTGKFAADGKRLLELEYGPANLLVRRALSSGETHTFQYDAKGRYTSANTLKDAIQFKYDAVGNLSVEKRNGLGVVHTYRSWGKFGRIVWLEKFICDYEVNNDDALVITDPTGGKQRLQIIKGGQVQRTLSNGTNESVKYDDVGLCESKEIRRSGRRNWERRFDWSGEGELREVSDSLHGKTNYAYDVAHRLVSRTASNGTVERFDYDDANNLISKPGAGDIALQSGNRLKFAGDSNFEYNDRNHICSRIKPSETCRYEFDSRDQLVKCETKNGIWSAEYDAIGRRVRKTFEGKTTEYLWNMDQLAGELSPDGRFRLYIYTDPLALTPMMFVDYESIESEPTDGECYFIFSDQIGTPVCIEDKFGKIVWQARIAPYGEATLDTSNKIEFNLRFPGHYWDNDLKLNYNRFRFYDPALGRFIQSDPLGIAGGTNIYAYSSNPLNFVDVRGLSCDRHLAGLNPNCPDCQDNEHTTIGLPPEPDAALLQRIGEASQVWTNREEEHPYRNPPIMYIVNAAHPIDINLLSPHEKYLWVVDPHGNMLIAPESQEGFGRVVKHGDLTPGPEGLSRGEARAGGELKYNKDQNEWVMDNESSYTFARADNTHSDGDSLAASHELLTNTGTDTSDVVYKNSHGSDAKKAPGT